MKSKNYLFFTARASKNICLIAISILLFLQGQSQILVSWESFPNTFNTSVTAPPPSPTFSGSIGTWGATGNNYATVAVRDTRRQSLPNALKLVNFDNNGGTASTATATSPIVSLAVIPAASTVTFNFWLDTYNITNGNSNSTFYVEFFNGSTWVTQYTRTADQLYDQFGLDQWTNITLNVPSTFWVAGFRYRFRGVNTANLQKDNWLYIDDIKITYTTNCGTGRTPDFSGTPVKIVDGGAVGGGFEVGDVYRYVNAVTNPANIHADVKIEAISNAQLVTFDQNGAGLGVTSRLQPEIKADVASLTADREGYIQYSITFRVAVNNALVFFTDLTFHHFDIDGYTNGTTGYLRETGWETGFSSISVNEPSDLTNAGNFVDGGFTWTKYLGELVNHDGFTSDPDILLMTTIVSGNTIRFRMGYKFVKGNGANLTPDLRLYAADVSCFTIAPNTPLPVRLTSFSGSYRNQKAMLNWTTDNEVNLENFEVQRSLNGSDFTTVGVLPANSSNIKSDYAFPDDLSNVNANALYYRLKMVDKSGEFKYSQVVLLRKDSKALNGITINPNPVTNGLATIRMSSGANGTVEIRVVDMTGKVLLRQNNIIAEGNNSIAINNLSRLKGGIYTVQVIDGEDITSSKLSIVR